MPLISSLGAASSRGLGEFGGKKQADYIEDYFSTYLYTGGSSGAAPTQLRNNIPLGTTAGWSCASLQNILIYGMDVDSSGNIYIAGYNNNGGYGYIAKLTPSFSIVWQVNYQGSGTFNRIKVASSGNVYATGYNTGQVTVTVKYNSSGTLQWQRTIAAQAGYNSIGNDLAIGSSEDIYVVGETRDATRLVAYAIKYNSSGTLQWQRTMYVAATAGGYAYGVDLDSSDNLYIQVYSSNSISLLKMNSSGSAVTENRFVTTGGQGKVAVDSSGNIYRVFRTGSNAAYFAKYNSSMVLQWQKTVTLLSSYLDPDIFINTSGEIYFSSGYPGLGYTLIKTDSSGSVLWQRSVSSPDSNIKAIASDSSGNVYVAGYPGSGAVSYIAALKEDGSTKSGYAVIELNESNYTIAAGSLTTGTGVLSVATSSFTTATPTATSSSASVSPTIQSQSATTASGGMVWIKARSTATDHAIYDTIRGAEKDIASNLTTGQTTQSTGLISFGATGPLIGTLAKINSQNNIFASWTFREKAKFFDIVTYTGNGANRTISHNLGSVPGMIIVKRTDTTGTWPVYHRSLANTQYMLLNDFAQVATGTTYWNSTTPTATEFSLGTATDVNANGGTYVAYLFAHDAGGFGLTGGDSVVSCGTFNTGAAGSTVSVTLGWEPQYIIIKGTNVASDWEIVDISRGMTSPQSGNTSWYLRADVTNAEGVTAMAAVTPTGFVAYTNGLGGGSTNKTYVYMAIRRGPMKVPTDGTTVFQPTVYTGTNVDNRLVNTTIAPDMVWGRQRNTELVRGMIVGDRLRGQPYLVTGLTNAENNDANAFDQQIASSVEYGTAFSSMSGVWVGNDTTARLNASTTANDQIMESFKRAPGFFDVVAYTGTGSARTITHNLGVVPELIIIKRRNGLGDWPVYSAPTLNTNYLRLNDNSPAAASSTFWNNTSPTSSVFTVGTAADVNASGATYIAYLFATCPGVSKVGSYTGTGTTNQINCGFSSGARFVLIKRSGGDNGNWYVYDSARGIVPGNDPFLQLDSTDAENSLFDYVDTYSPGFQLSSTAPTALNGNGGTFIFLAIA